MVSHLVMLIYVQISVDASMFQSVTKSMQLLTVNPCTVTVNIESTLNQHSIFSGNQLTISINTKSVINQ